MTPLLADGRVFGWLIAFSLGEAIALILWHRRTGRGLPGGDVMFHLAAGVFLCAAAWLSMAGAPWIWIALSLAGSGVTHIVDLRRRWARA